MSVAQQGRVTDAYLRNFDPIQFAIDHLVEQQEARNAPVFELARRLAEQSETEERK